AFSGIAVGIGLSGLLFFPRSYLSAMGLGGAIVVALAVLAALTFLPALLAVLGDRVDAGRLPVVLPPMDGFWRAVAHTVMARPVLILVPTLALLILFGLPFGRVKLASADVRVLPPGVEARRGPEVLAAETPTLAANQVAIVVQFPSAPALTAERTAALRDLSKRVAAIPGVARVDSIADYEMLLRLPRGLRPAGLDFALKSS